MLTELCENLRNYFCFESDKHFGKFTISGGAIEPLDFLKEGQYFRIVGSVLNDGVYQYPANCLNDEEFHGAIWGMRVPSAVIELSQKIDEYKKNDSPSAYTSESFGGYSYSKALNSNGTPMSWQNVFSNELNKWRKI